jgi:hypothetical protein
MLMLSSITMELLKNRRWMWISPLFFIFLIAASGASSSFFKNSSIAYLAYTACAGIGGLLLLSCIMVLVNHIFDAKNAWVDEISSFHSMGYGFSSQILYRFASILLIAAAYAGLFSFLYAKPARVFLFIPPFILSLIMFRLIGLWLNFPALVYVPVILTVISLFYPVYLLPNPVFVVKGQIGNVSAYVFTYSCLYLLVDIRLSYYTWRDICIGRIY